jgi:hypothetical protein
MDADLEVPEVLGPTKRSASEGPPERTKASRSVGGFHASNLPSRPPETQLTPNDDPREFKQQRIGTGPLDFLEEVERCEEASIHINKVMPLMLCEEEMDLSFEEDENISKIAHALKHTPVSFVRDMLERQLATAMLELYNIDKCPTDLRGSDGVSPIGSTGSSSSIFDQGSRLGIVPEEDEEDYWVRNEGTSSWTRVILVPRTQPYHPAEGVSDHSEPTLGPDLRKLRDLRITVYDGGGVVRGNWRKDDSMVEDAAQPAVDCRLPPMGAPWTGKCTFYENWEKQSDRSIGGMEAMPSGLV